MPVDPFIDDLLSYLERRESRLLSWGFYDSTFRPNDIEHSLTTDAPRSLLRAWRVRRRAGERLDQLFARLADAGLLFRPDPGNLAYRTRFAEGVRLLARLRQMFRLEHWNTGPTLVSDIKLHIQRRKYPHQDQSPVDCWSDLAPHASNPALEHELFTALSIGRNGNPISFAGFQRRSFSRIYRAFGQIGASGTVVSAGTGAGKTKAFYVPALLRVAGELQRPPFAKVIAIYPRNVLLADQLREALSEAAKLTPVLSRHRLRPIRFGALLGQTPWLDSFTRPERNTVRAVAWNKWEQVTGGFKIPFLRSPAGDTDLIWRDDDRLAGRHCLRSRNDPAAPPHLEDGVLAFTRDELLREPPDILFLSAEMLNREMGTPDWERVLGLRQPADRSPRLLLLDEVHSYEGIPGAQIAWILRRWRHWSKPRSLHVVGLSATLRDPVRHLASVAGIRSEDIVALAPDEDAGELKSESQEYNLLVKGDAGSGAGLLSTTIQTAMLLSRLLTPMNWPPSAPGHPSPPEDYFARKLFGFTDNLDVVNRLLSDLVNAEQGRRLAALRLHPDHKNPPPNPRPSRAVIGRMETLGQIWELPRRLGHDLTRPMTVGRCSSQDPGLDVDRSVTVATSTLEVGYDDPEVGAVIQHKSPSSLASFVQRKGRAGRRRGTRPWTAVVLSDFGRDRWNFQQAERLFAPQIEALKLPTGNPYVLRIQATYFLLDWLGRQIGSRYRRGPFSYLSHPTDSAFHQRVAQLLRELLMCGQRWEQFRSELTSCFRQTISAEGRRLSEPEIDAIIWQSPRPLLREVIPTLYRKVSAGWSLADPQATLTREDESAHHPLPGFIPSATFSDLDASEVLIILPGPNSPTEGLGIGHALFETCPGRASKRYSLGTNDPGNWHPLSVRLTGGDVRALVSDAYPNAIDLGIVSGLRVFQPTQVHVVPHIPTVSESSNAAWEWESDFQTEGESRSMRVPAGTRWAAVFRSVDAYLHREQSCVEVTRFARSNAYEILQQRGQNIRGRLLLEQPSDGVTLPAAVGFQLKVDAIRVQISGDHLASRGAIPSEIVERFRVDYFLHLLKQSAVITLMAGPFQAELLGQTAVAMLSATALRNRSTLQAAQPLLINVRQAAADRVMRTFFQVADPTGGSESRTRRQIRQLWADPAVAAEVTRLEEQLWLPPDATFFDWCIRRYLSTLAQAIRTAFASREDNIAEEDLTADVVWNGTGDASIFITEQSPGGLGLLEQVWRRLREDPSQFTDGLEYAIDYCPRAENTAYVLNVVRAALDRSGPRLIARAFHSVRAARELSATERAKVKLRSALRQEGFPATREGVVSLLTRVLRTGSFRATDALLDWLNRLWRRRERTLGIAVDSRVFAYLCAQRGRPRFVLRRIIGQIGQGATPTKRQLFALVQQMLLLNCADSCPECLDQPNRYSPAYKPSRGLARHFLGGPPPEISSDANPTDWPALIRAELALRATSRLRVSRTGLASVAARLPDILAEEVEVDYLLMPIRIRRIDEIGTDTIITFDLRDAVHG
jgi:hypothetical protein